MRAVRSRSSNNIIEQIKSFIGAEAPYRSEEKILLIKKYNLINDSEDNIEYFLLDNKDILTIPNIPFQNDK